MSDRVIEWVSEHSFDFTDRVISYQEKLRHVKQLLGNLCSYTKCVEKNICVNFDLVLKVFEVQ